MSRSSTLTVPWLGRRMPEIMLSSVVLPLPEGPTMESISSKWASKVTSLHGHGAGLALAEPLGEPSGLGLRGVIGSAPEDVEGLDLQHLADGDVAGDGREITSTMPKASARLP